mmetsp:Transcript_17811/g.38159  ORF Transcript_17811/g.38159 Transcript_17811/m.38159 type:complete len:258 (+) Transcript_17811:534-1307(+)
MVWSKAPETRCFPSGSQSKQVILAVCRQKSVMATEALPPDTAQTKILFPASALARKLPAGVNFKLVTSLRCSCKTLPGVNPSGEPASVMLKSWRSNWVFCTPGADMPSGLSKPMATRPATAETPMAVGRLGTAFALVHSTPDAPTQIRESLPVATSAFVSSLSNQAALTANSPNGIGDPTIWLPSTAMRLRLSSRENTQASAAPEKAGEWARMCWIPLPIFALETAPCDGTEATKPSPPPWIRAPVLGSQATQESGP